MRRNQTLHETLIPLLVEGIGAKSYLELGVYQGATLERVKCAKRFGVDINAEPDMSVAFPDWGLSYFRMTTQEFIMQYAASLGPFDVVFIDAEHSEDAVRKDFEGIWPHVSPEGLILLHDTNPETKEDTAPGLCGDAWRFAYSKAESMEAVTLPYHPGLTIIRKRIWWGPHS